MNVDHDKVNYSMSINRLTYFAIRIRRTEVPLPPATMKSEHANLDVLRSTAVLLVLVSHVIMATGHLDDPLLKAWGLRQVAQLGVLLFFIHTSLVLMMSLRRLEAAPNMVARFYIRRVFRIYPLAIVTIACAVFLRSTSF